MSQKEDSLAACWRGGRGRSGLVSLEMWPIANEDLLEGREWEEWAGELGNMAHHCDPDGKHWFLWVQ